MNEPEGQPQLSCQELSKQCNDIDSSSSHASCSDVCQNNLCRTLFPDSNSQKLTQYRKDSIGNPILNVWDEALEKEMSMTRSDLAKLREESANYSEQEMRLLLKRDNYDDDDDDDDDDIYEDRNELRDADTSNRQPSDYSRRNWLPSEATKCSYVNESPDFLDDIESSLHSQVDGEIDAFRCNLHAIISHQHVQCRNLLTERDEHYFNQEQDMGSSQTVKEDAWSSDLMLNSTDQQRLEAMSTSTASLQGEDRGTQYISTTEENGSSRDELLNRITIQLLTSALAISNAVHREEYTTTKHEV